MRAFLVLSCLFVASLSVHAQDMANTGRASSSASQTYLKKTQPAEFPGGSEKLGKYLAKHLRYPASLLKAGIYPPTVMVSFKVTETGAIEEVEVVKLRQQDYIRLEPYLAKVVNTIERMPRWKPATQGNAAITSRHIIPVSIDIK